MNSLTPKTLKITYCTVLYTNPVGNFEFQGLTELAHTFARGMGSKKFI